jgi:uncharacterized protein
MKFKRTRHPLRQMRLLIAVVAALFVVSVLFQQIYFPPAVKAVSSNIVISEFRVRGPNGGNDEFIELYNLSTAPVSIGGWKIRGSSNTGAIGDRATITSGTSLMPGCHYLLTNSTTTAGPYSGSVPGDQTYSTGIADDGGLAVTLPDNTIVDQVGMSAGSAFKEGTPLANLGTSNLNRGYERKPGGAAGSGTDTDNNSNDFVLISPSDPQNSTSGCISPSPTPTPSPTLSINDVSVTEGNSGSVTATFTVSLSTNVHTGVTFDIATADGTGPSAATTADNDYVARALAAQLIPAGQQTYAFDVTVNGDTNFESNETFFVNVTNVSGATVADGQGVGTITNDDCSPPAADIVISQVYGGGGNSGATYTHDFIELFNQGSTTVNLSGWSVQYASATGTTWQVTALSGSIAPGGYYLIQEASNAPVGSPLPTPDATGTINMSGTSGKVALSSSTTAFSGSCPTCPVDFVGYGGANCFEGSGPTGTTSNTTAALRKRGGCFDSNNNNTDFSVGSPNPHNSSSPTNNCQPISAAIHDIQGSGATTPYAGQLVTTTGIVTGLKSNGFFMQDAEANYDADAATSEGIFVFTSSAPAVAVGDYVSVLGTASEFFNLTQIESTLPGDVTLNSSGNSLPLPTVLTTSILDPAGTPDQLERFEGMRMHADTLVSVAPTNNFGETFTVLDGVARPLREPGIEISLPIPSDPSSTANIPRWDENPERIMIDSDGMAGSSVISVTSNVTFSNVTGPLDFTFSDYKILPEMPPTTSANMSAVPVPAPESGEFTIAGFNIENFNNNATQRRKAALAIRDVLHLPDIIGTSEIFELSGLQALAAEINTLTGTTNYQAYLIEADGTSGDNDQDVGFLVNTSKVQVNSTTQEELPDCNGTAANCYTFTDPNSGLPALLNDRPPLTLRATVDPAGTNPVPVIVVVNHTRSFIGIEGDDNEGRRVRAKRKAQAEFLANLLQQLQTNSATTPIMSIGDYNAYQFNDGYTDPVSVIKGTPTADDQMVVDQSLDVVSPDFINLTDELPADQRYSFIFEGTPQALDHMVVNTVAHAMLQRYAVGRNNSDFPELPASAFSGDATRPERCSDHDIPVAYFKPLADLSVTKGASPEPVITGSDVTYTISVTNNGPNTAQAVVVTDNLPAETTFVSCNATGGGVCSGTGNNRAVSFTALASGASETITIIATVNCEVANGTLIDNTAAVSSNTTDSDNSNNSDTVTTTASNPPPTITLTTHAISLWPPNHTYRTVTVAEMVASASDNCDPNVNVNSVVIASVTSDELENAPGGADGNTLNDIVIAADCKSVQLRAERHDSLDGRVYTVTLKVTDSSGNVTTATRKVTVPISPDAGNVVDSGPVYTVNSACP